MKTITEIQEAIELLKNETAVFEVTRIGDDKYTLTIKSKPENTIKVGDYFIARKPEYVTQTPVWDVYMCRYDGVIQKCEEIRNSYIRSDNDTPLYHPSWCEKVSVGDVMKTEYDDLFIFKGVSDGDYLDFAYYKGGKPPKLFIDDTPNSMVAVSHATKVEEQVLFNALAKNGKKWNKEKMCVEDVVKPKSDEECLRAWGCGEKAIDDYMKYSEKYDMVSKLYAENSFRQLPFIDVLYESYMLDKRKSLKQIIKLCKQLLNE